MLIPAGDIITAQTGLLLRPMTPGFHDGRTSRGKALTFVFLLVLLSLLLPSGAPATVPPPRNPNSAKSCAICHYRWIDTFFTEGRGTELVAYHAEKVAATPEMCMSCHDGSVVDSRKRMGSGAGHKTNVSPPAGMKIPDIFPLDENGRVQCATCHTAHGVPSGPDSHETIFMRTSNRDSNMCRMCHVDKTGGPSAGNHSMGSVEKGFPRQLAAGYGKPGVQKNQVICESCHTAHGSSQKSFLVNPTGRSQLCLACHRDKRSFTADGRKTPAHIVNVVPVKARVPAAVIERGARLGDTGALICQTCHKVHDNDIEKPLLVIPRDRKSGFCLTCHPDKQSIADTRHNLAHSAPDEKNLAGQTVAQAGVCSACHLPHKAARKLAGKKKDYTSRLCLSCHAKGRVAEKVNLSGETHPLDVDPFKKGGMPGRPTAVDTTRNELKLPLFDRSGVQDKNGNMTCATCHDTHRPATAPAEKTGPGRGMRSTFFLRKPQPEICRQCHRSKFNIAGSRHDLAKSAPNARNILKQKPAQAGLCGSCHLVHGSRRGFLWARRTGGGVGVVQSLCFSCHNEKGIARKKVHHGYSHPMNIRPAGTGTRVRGLPLFDKKGKFRPNGLITCPTCHDPHQWRPPAERTQSGRRAGKSHVAFTSFLRRQSPDICRACHVEKFFIKGSKHDLGRVAPGSRNIAGQTPAESGLCAACHLVHNAQRDFLWARRIKPGRATAGEALCVGCHRPQGLASDKVIGGRSHPLNVSPADRGLGTTLPLYGEHGGPVQNGVVSCPTCHDPHRWTPRRRAGKNLLKTEGDARNSFLRLENAPAPLLCTNCHRRQGVVQKTDHDLLAAGATATNDAGQTPVQSGTCGVCHLVHNGRQPVRLWARELTGRGPVMDRLCNSCHKKGGPAGKKIPAIASHPSTAIVDVGKSLRAQAGHLPLFDGASGEPVRVGNLSCPSCHNAHQWKQGAPAAAAGQEVEGDATNSFLRSRARDTLCKDCHGPDALFRYKFFHKPGARLARQNRPREPSFRTFRPARKP